MGPATDGRIVVLASGAGSNLAALIESCRRGEVPGNVVALAADRSCAALDRAADADAAPILLEFSGFASRAEWSRALRDRVAEHHPDLVVSAGFMRIVAPVFVDAFAGRFINLHPALLPAFPGAHAVRDALEHGVKVTGSTVHLVDYEVDHGPILLQEAVPVLPGDTEETLHERIKAVEHRILPEACRLLLEGRVGVTGRRAEILS